MAATIYGSWFALTAGWAEVPAWAAIPAMAWLLAWHGSLQHETIHGHPTSSVRVNAALGRAFHDAEALLRERLGGVTLAALSDDFHRRMLSCQHAGHATSGAHSHE